MEILPDKQNIDQVFSNTAYYIDFYQRDYRWTSEPVKRLLDDIFYKFKERYERASDLDPGKETIITYPWYYLNTYVTNVVDGRVYVVDGQQRLTTLSLILIKLRHLAKKHDSALAGWIDSKPAARMAYLNERSAVWAARIKLAGVRKFPAFCVTCRAGWPIATHHNFSPSRAAQILAKKVTALVGSRGSSSFVAFFLRLG